MTQSLIDYLEQRAGLSPSSKALLVELVDTQEMPKGTTILQAGDISREFYFVVQGCVRLYYVTDAGVAELVTRDTSLVPENGKNLRNMSSLPACQTTLQCGLGQG